MDDEQRIQIKKFIDLLLRRKKMIMAFFLFAIGAGLFIYTRTPKVYLSSSMIMYQQQKINPGKMSPDEARKIGEMVSTVSQQVTSRTSLENIINQYGLYKELREKLPMEDIITKMREKHIEIKSQKEKGDIFSVSFTGDDPAQVRMVTNAIAAKFVEENIRFREELASENSAYIQDELQIIKETLDKREKIMRDYKLKYYNEMPEQRKGNMDRLNALQEQLSTNQNNIQTLEQTRLLLNEQISNKLHQQKTAEAELKTENNVDDLPKLKKSLEALLTRYTEEHPNVTNLKGRIESLERLQAQAATEQVRKAPPPDDKEISELDKLKTQLKEMELSLGLLKQERLEILKQINKYQQWVDAAPIREAEWSSLTRDYVELKKHYESLVAQSLAAESAETLEKRQKGSQFKIIEQAFLPEEPIKPNFLKSMATAMAVGLGLGIGLTLVFSFIDPSFKEASEIESYTGVSVLCSVPSVTTIKEKWFRVLAATIWSLLFIAATGLLVYYSYFYYESGVIIL